MSKIGKKPIIIPSDIKVAVADDSINFENSKGKLSVKVLSGVSVEMRENQLNFSIKGLSKQSKSNWGTLRSLAQNAVLGLSNGFSKTLEIHGIGFRAVQEGDSISLNIGYSHPVKFTPPAGVKVIVEKNIITVSGTDKILVGQAAAEIRALKKPEPYKGKGIRYKGEAVRHKQGKKMATAAS
ncbi:MAG: 50S ribosomal protein L6 [Candidatus Brennerbacteria bacterium]|nr:50S ribosomal protein L6 [Candidatus Brennerbacteria bacterium]